MVESTVIPTYLKILRGAVIMFFSDLELRYWGGGDTKREFFFEIAAPMHCKSVSFLFTRPSEEFHLPV